MSELYVWPDGRELIESVVEVLVGLRGSVTDPRDQFQLRVAIHALRIVARELELGPEQDEAHASRLAQLGAASDAELVTWIREAVDDRLLEVLRPVLLADAEARLAVLAPAFVAAYEDDRREAEQR